MGMGNDKTISVGTNVSNLRKEIISNCEVNGASVSKCQMSIKKE